VAQLTPDILLLPIHSGNGVTAGVGIGYTQADADLQVSIAMQYAEWALNNGVKHVVFVTPMPSTTPNYNGMYANLTSLVAASGFPYLDTMSVVANQDLTWKANYSIDGGHPTALANAALAVELADVLRPYTMLA
jgi:lysophospholipase L1-like esterase